MEHDSGQKYALGTTSLAAAAAIQKQQQEALKRLFPAQSIASNSTVSRQLKAMQGQTLASAAAMEALRPTFERIETINRDLIGASRISETLDALSGGPAMRSITAGLNASIAQAVRPSFAIHTAIFEEALRPSRELQESFKLITGQITAMADVGARISQLAGIGAAFAAAEQLGNLTASYAAYADEAALSEPELLELDDDLAENWRFIRWYSGLSRRDRDMLLGSLIALTGHLYALMNAAMPADQRGPGWVSDLYDAMAVLFGIVCFIRSSRLGGDE